MKSNQRGVGAVLALIWLVIVVVGVIGWGLNISDLVTHVKADLAVNAMFILRCVGIFVFPLGAVLGYCA